MKPERVASVCSRPTVCMNWATAYTTPRPTPTWISRLVRARSCRQNTASTATAAMVKRTARKSAGDICRTTLRIRKKVEPQIAVRPTRSSVATWRERAAVTSDGPQITVSVMVEPWGALVPASTDWSLTVPKNPPNARSIFTVKPSCSSIALAVRSCWPMT